VLVTTAIALVMAPAALHRQMHPMAVQFVRISSRLLMASLGPLAVGICLDVYLVALVIVGGRGIAASIAGFLLVVFAVAWLLVPQLARRRAHHKRHGVCCTHGISRSR